jgi:hypothetical protein
MTGLYITWYRYWLEFRSRLLALAVVALYMGLRTPDSSTSQHVWIAFTSEISFFAWVASVCLMGNGISIAWQRRHPSVCFTLTLPISRQKVIWIYQSANCVAGIFVIFFAVAAYGVVLVLQGQEFPLFPLAISLAFGSLFVIAWTTILGGLTLVMHELWALVVSVPLFLISIPWVRSTVTLRPAYGEFPWISVAALLAITALALAFSLIQSREQEFG